MRHNAAFLNRVVLSIITGFMLCLITGSIGFAMDENALSHVISLPENENVLFVEKESQTFRLYSRENGRWVKQLDVPCSTGEVGGVKVQAGDKKTPEGIYFLTDEYEDRYLTPVYGKRAFPIDYPNYLDRIEGKNGSAIWIHGTNKVLKPMDSNGCIALENENVVKLSDYISLNSTPVIIVEKFSRRLSETEIQNVRFEVERLLDDWSKALEGGTYHDFLGFYSASYLPDIAYWREWQKVVQLAGQLNLQVQLDSTDVGIYRHKDILTVIFEQILRVGDRAYSAGRRKLYVMKEDKGYRIIGDVKQTVPETMASGSEPIVDLMAALVNPQMENERVIAAVKNWLKAWSGKAMDEYASYYASDFYSDGMNKTQWVTRKKVISKKYTYISVKGSDFKISNLTDTKCDVRFYQVYESSGFSAKGIKTLKLVKEGGLWKISRESWKKK